MNNLVKKSQIEPFEYKKGFFMSIDTKTEWQGRAQPEHIPTFKTQFPSFVWEKVFAAENPRQWIETFMQEDPIHAK